MEKIKSFVDSEKGKDILTIAIVILVGLCSFLLGRMSIQSNSRGLKINYIEPSALVANTNGVGEQRLILTSEKEQNIIESPSPKTGNFFASKKGKKYYPVSCSAGKSIKQDNRVYFDDREEAEKAGYTISSACK